MQLMKITGGSVLGMFVSLLWIGGASAVPTLYHSPGDDGNPPPGPVVVGLGVQTLHLYIDGGTQASSALPCEEGDGDEVCTWEVSIVPTGGVTLQGFVDGSGVESNLDPGLLRAIGGNPFTGDLGPTKMGDLTINSATPGTVDLDSGASVNAAQSIDILTPAEVVSVPEPQGTLSLLCGAIGLWVMLRRRSRAGALNG